MLYFVQTMPDSFNTIIVSLITGNLTYFETVSVILFCSKIVNVSWLRLP